MLELESEILYIYLLFEKCFYLVLEILSLSSNFFESNVHFVIERLRKCTNILCYVVLSIPLYLKFGWICDNDCFD